MDLYTVRNNIMKGVPLQELNLRVCFYARVSTDKDDQLNSLENQSNYFREMIGENKKWNLVGEYIDEGISGKNLEREAIKRLINDIKQQKINNVLVFKISLICLSSFTTVEFLIFSCNNS